MSNQLNLPLVYDDDLYPLNPTIFDNLDREYYVTFSVGETSRATMSGKIIGRRKNGNFVIDPGGSGWHLMEVPFNKLIHIEGEVF